MMENKKAVDWSKLWNSVLRGNAEYCDLVSINAVDELDDASMLSPVRKFDLLEVEGGWNGSG